LPLNHERTTSSLAPPIFYVAKNWQLEDRRLPIYDSFLMFQIESDPDRDTFEEMDNVLRELGFDLNKVSYLTNILRTTFTLVDPKSVKIQLMKLSQGVVFQ